jgi:hypothetical protein
MKMIIAKGKNKQTNKQTTVRNSKRWHTNCGDGKEDEEERERRGWGMFGN